MDYGWKLTNCHRPKPWIIINTAGIGLNFNRTLVTAGGLPGEISAISWDHIIQSGEILSGPGVGRDSGTASHRGAIKFQITCQACSWGTRLMPRKDFNK
ncbi:MAG: hypothetical protein RLZZ490_1647 [Cyanobacteriota bacterium]